MKILVIDDDPAMTDLMKLVLEPMQAEIHIANSAQEGIVLARRCSPEVILLDLVMPDMCGREVCGEIRKFSATPILILSALDNPSLIAEALNAGADDFLIKPVANSILLAHIQKLMRRAAVEIMASRRN